MSIGCLIIGSRTTPVEEVIQHGQTGLLVDFFKPSEIASSVADAIKNRKDLLPLRRAARRHIVENYDLEARCLPAQLKFIHTIARTKKVTNNAER